MELRPLGDRVVVKRADAEEKTASGLILTGTAKEQPQIAEVVAVGPGAIYEGKRIEMEVAVGDKVFFSKYGGTEIKFEGQEYIILGQADILAVVK